MHEGFVDSIGRLDKGLHFEQSLTRRADLGCRLNDSEIKVQVSKLELKKPTSHNMTAKLLWAG